MGARYPRISSPQVGKLSRGVGQDKLLPVLNIKLKLMLIFSQLLIFVYYFIAHELKLIDNVQIHFLVEEVKKSAWYYCANSQSKAFVKKIPNV